MRKVDRPKPHEIEGATLLDHQERWVRYGKSAASRAQGHGDRHPRTVIEDDYDLILAGLYFRRVSGDEIYMRVSERKSPVAGDRVCYTGRLGRQ